MARGGDTNAVLKYLVCWMKISAMEKNTAGKSGSEEWSELQFKTGGPEKALL